MYKVLKYFFIMIIAAVLLCGCTEVSEGSPVQITETTAESEMPYPVTVSSLVFEKAPETVGSLSPAITEIICELGYDSKIIGRSSYCDYPESISTRNELGSSANPDVDAIIAAAPELLISMSPIAKKDITAIEAAGTRVWIVQPPKSVEELYICYNDIASVFEGKLGSADVAKNTMKSLITSVSDVKGTFDSFVYIMSADLAVATDASFAGAFFSHFGRNSAGSIEGLSLSVEELIELDPEWIIMPEYISKYELPEETAELSAIKDNHIIYLDENMLERIERPTTRLESIVYNILDQVNAVKSGAVAAETEYSSENGEE